MQNDITIERHNEVTDALYAIFPRFVRDNNENIDFGDPEVSEEIAEWYWSPADVHLLAYRNDELVGVAHVTKRDLEYLGQAVKVGFLGALVISKSHRHAGIAKLLIEAQLNIVKEWNCDIAFLNTDIMKLGGMFAKFGFVPLGHNYSFKGNSGVLHEDNSGMIAPITSLAKFKLLLDNQTSLFIGNGNL